MSFFKSKPKSFLGVDLGAGGIKVVEIEKFRGRSHLLTYGYTERSPEITGKSIVDDKKTGGLLAKICQKAKVKSNKAIAGLPVSSVFSSIITVTSVSEKELKSAVESQARKLLSYPVEESVLDWKILDEEKDLATTKQPAGSSRQKWGKTRQARLQRVLLTAAPRELINKYVEIFKTAKLELLYLETEAFAIIRSLVGKDKSVVTIVDIGAVKTNILIIDAGTPIVTRSINIGGAMITKILSEKMKIGVSEAEEMKRDTRYAERVVAAGDKSAGLPKPIELLLTPVINEIRYCFNLYLKQNANEDGVSPAVDGTSRKVEKIILSGGTALFPQLANYFSQVLNIKVLVGNPWARVLFPDELKPDLDELGSRFAVAIGLATREME